MQDLLGGRRCIEKEIIHFSSGSLLGSHPHETLILFEATVQLFAIETKIS